MPFSKYAHFYVNKSIEIKASILLFSYYFFILFDIY